MRNLKQYAVINADGTVARVTSVPEFDMEIQATEPGQTVRLAGPADLQALADRQAAFETRLAGLRAQARAEPTEADVVLEALKAKLTPGELAAARTKLRDARKGPA